MPSPKSVTIAGCAAGAQTQARLERRGGSVAEATRLGEMRIIADDMRSVADQTPPTLSPLAAAPSRPVDLAHLARYTLGERALEREVLKLFHRQAGLCVERLVAAEADPDWKEAAHTLKGSARAVGAWRVADAAERAEALSGAALAESRAAALRELELAVGEAQSYIQVLLEDR